MKKTIYVLLIFLVFIIGMNIGSEDDETRADIVQDKIEEFETNMDYNNTVDENVSPNIFNKLANKCNDLVDKVIDKVMNSVSN